MLKTLVDKLQSMEDKVKKVLHNGFIFSFIVCLLISYELSANLELYYIGLSVFRLSLFFAVEFFICAIAIDTIKKQIC